MLSAKLFEDKLVFIDTEALEFPKTQYLETIIAPFSNDKLCFLTAKDLDQNFKRASSNLQLVKTKSAQKFHVPDLINNDYVFVTKQGLIELESILESRHANYFRNRKVASEQTIARWKERKMDKFEKRIIQPIVHSESLPNYDDSKPLDITTPALRAYVAHLAMLKGNAPKPDAAKAEGAKVKEAKAEPAKAQESA